MGEYNDIAGRYAQVVALFSGYVYHIERDEAYFMRTVRVGGRSNLLEGYSVVDENERRYIKSTILPRYSLLVEGEAPPIDWRQIEIGRLYTNSFWTVSGGDVESFIMSNYVGDIEEDYERYPKQPTVIRVVDIIRKNEDINDVAVLCEQDDGDVYVVPYTAISISSSSVSYSSNRKLIYEFNKWRHMV